MKKFAFISLIILSVAVAAKADNVDKTAAQETAQDAPLWLRRNAISPDGKQIAFTYKGDIYVVDSKGGKAQQLTTNAAYDSDPKWTLDSKNIIFSSYREKSKDIYRMSAKGGEPTRLTSHTGHETPMAVMEDGSVIFSGTIMQDAQYGDFPGGSQIYQVGPDGGRPVHITSLQIANLCVGLHNTVYYEDYKGYEDPWRKHHTSSVTHDIWRCVPDKDPADNLHPDHINGNGTFTKLTSFKGEDRNPVLHGDNTLYYLSEQDGTFNVYKIESLVDMTEPEQVTFYKGNPVRHLSISQYGVLCYSYDGELYTLNTLENGAQPQKVNIEIVTDQTERQMEERTMTTGAKDLAVSPGGKEVAIIIRGDVFVTSTEHKTTKRITNTPEQERDLWFSKDGRTIYYSAERNGHWGIWKTSLTDKADKMFTYAVKMEEELVTKPGETCFQPQVSPDGESLAYLKDRTAIAVMDLKSGKERILLDKSINYSYQDGDQSFAWSPDSRYILCNYQANGGWNNEDVAVIDTKTGEITDLTESGYSDGSFRWALKGKAMTWTSDKAGYKSHGSWGAEKDVYIMFFDGKAHSEFVKDKEGKQIADMMKTEKEEKKEAKDSVKAEKKAEEFILDLADRKDRIVKLTRFSGRMGDHYLTQDGKTLYYVVRLEKSQDLCKMNLEDNSITVVSKGTSGSIYPTADDKFFYILSGGRISKINTATGKAETITYSGEFEYKPAQEREYIFNHAWKQVNEKFYDATIHGIDWEGYRETYAKFLPHINNNFDFKELLSEMLGELNGSHTGARYSYKSGFNMGTLGAFYDNSYEGDGLKIAEIIKGGALYIQHPEIMAGDIITAINGEPIVAEEDWHRLLKGKGGEKIVITVKQKGKKEQDLFIEPEFTDYTQLYNRWVDQRAQMVKELSGGRIGYVHVEGMDSESFRRVYSDLLGKYRTCEAVIVDTRHNGGGWLHDDLATLLSGTGYIRFEPRGQYIGTEPYSKWTKPSCVLIGEDNYSDASGFPYIYQALGIGKLIGAPVPGTMTAVWWETQIDPTLVFGIPQVGAIGVKDGRYLENMQVEPDIEVYNDPASVLRGEDKQLEAAVAEMLKTIDNK